MPADREWPTDAAIEAAWDELDARSPEHLVFGEATAEEVLRVAAKASPVVPVPPCPECRGEGLAPTVGYDVTMGADPLAVRVACSSCKGSGHDRLIPKSTIMALIDDLRLHDDTGDQIDVGYMDALDDLSAQLDDLMTGKTDG